MTRVDCHFLLKITQFSESPNHKNEFKILNMITKPNKGGVTFKKDEDIYKYYGITKDEQKLIEEVVDHVKPTKRTHEKKQIQTQKKKKGGRRKNKRTIRKRRR